jgi:phosphoadenosine phosphosulfate reductase
MSLFEPLERHDKIALSFSGGKDSLACVHLFRDHLDRITIYHNDTGDLLPEMMESVARVEAFAPHFVRINSNVSEFIAKWGLPTDLLPYSAHPIGRAMGEGKNPLVSRYDCCWSNLMFPLYARVLDDKNTLLIRGTKSADMNVLPITSGEVTDGIEIYYPIQSWTNDDVMIYLRRNQIPIPRLYKYMTNSPECARCSAWWGEGRAAYLRQFHPDIWADYDKRLQVVIDEVALPLANLRREAGVTE